MRVYGWFRQRAAVLIGAFLVVISIGLFAILKPDHLISHPLDPLVKAVLDDAGEAQSYIAAVETDVDLGDRSMHISGIYMIDRIGNRFASLSTTTLTIHKTKSQSSFTLQNISIEDDVYTKVQTRSSALAKTILNDPKWLHFKNTEIPREYAGIAIAGPVLDNLLLVSAKQRFLAFVKKLPDERIDGRLLSRYTFTLSGEVPDIDGSLSALLQRIGPSGTVDLFVDTQHKTLALMVFHNDNYNSTTTLSHMNAPLSIQEPLLSPL